MFSQIVHAPASAIEIDRVVKTYPRASRNALDGLSLSVSPGEFVALLGPNGAGKSTLIKILTTGITPTSGSVRLGGFDVVAFPREARAKTAFVLQDINLDKVLTVEENIRIGAALYGVFPYALRYAWMPSAYRKRLEELAAVLRLGGDLHTSVGKLSGGTQRRAELLRALLVQPRILLLDEPTVGLDPSTRQDLWQFVADLRSKFGLTVLVTTHYLVEAETADRAVILRAGQVAVADTPEGLRRRFASMTVILDAVDRLTLGLDLARLNLDVRGKGPYTVVAPPIPPHEIVQSLHVPLTALDVRHPTLEEAYLRVTQSEPSG